MLDLVGGGINLVLKKSLLQYPLYPWKSFTLRSTVYVRGRNDDNASLTHPSFASGYIVKA